MAFRHRDDGQVILLAGILLVLGFIAFSVQLAVLSNLGQQAGRELSSPLLDDFLIVRRTLQTYGEQEMLDDTGLVECPDMYDFMFRFRGLLGLVRAQESNRGHAFDWDDLSVGVVSPAGPNPILQTTVQLSLADAVTSVGEIVTFEWSCEGVIVVPDTCGGGVCVSHS